MSEAQAPPAVLLLGDPRLRQRAAVVDLAGDRSFSSEAKALHARLRAFREAHGFGRAIAAPQIGVLKRFIALDLGEGPCTLVNPEISWRSSALFHLWDDCMSFPGQLVKVARHCSISVRFHNPTGQLQSWERVPAALAELLQHEIDHLDGVLAIDRALTQEDIVDRATFEADRDRFEAALEAAPQAS